MTLEALIYPVVPLLSRDQPLSWRRESPKFLLGQESSQAEKDPVKDAMSQNETLKYTWVGDLSQDVWRKES